MAGWEAIDLGVLVILLIAALRGLSLGLIREAFSIGALGAAVIAVRVWNEPFTKWLQEESRGAVSVGVAPWLAGALLAVGVVVAVGIFGRVMRQGARAVGLGWFDRLGGAALGVAEGALAASLLLFLIGGFLGRDHAVLQASRSFAWFERAEQIAGTPALLEPDVAAPPRKR